MKKWFVIILLFITATGTFVPCCADGCADEVSATEAGHEEEHDDKGSCSPLFACSTCAPSVIIHVTEVLLNPPVINNRHHVSWELTPLATFHPSFFQPPKMS